ncbi:MAG: ATP-binding protein, partial [Planctomycetota bacterium]
EAAIPREGREPLVVEITATCRDRVECRVTVADITDRKRAEEQLRRAQKMEAIGQLAGGIAHEIRNQLQVILGYGEMLLRRSLVTAEGQAMLQEIFKAAERLSTVTGLLLAYGRKELLHPIVVSLRDCVAEIGKLLPHLVGEDIGVMIQSSTDECTVSVDPHLFQQAMLNLATNARDATPKGGTLTIETTCVTLGAESREIDPELAEGPYIVVSVSDTGSGMDEATLSRTLDPFFTTKGEGKGTGLGLPMVYGFVKQSGGAVAIQSEPGHGTTVRLYFSRVATAIPAAEPDRQPAKAIHGGGETILLVEDESAVRAVAAELLREVGYRVLEAADANQALSLAGRYNGTIALLVTDIVMPGMNGVRLAEQLQGRYPDLGVLYISGYNRRELSRRGVTESVAAIDKPFTSESLLEHVRNVLHDGAKKITCFHQLAELIETCDSSADPFGVLFHGAADILSAAWQYPKITCARIVFAGKEYATSNYAESPWIMSTDLVSDGTKSGVVEVRYLKESPPLDEGPFMMEERALINAVAERLGRCVEWINAQQLLRALQLALRNQDIALGQVLDKVQQDKEVIGRQVVANIDKIIMPMLADLDRGLSGPQRRSVGLLRDSLAEITSPFIHGLSIRFDSLTPAEVRVCDLIKRGMSCKEIATAEHVSQGTVRVQRFKIRSKLGLLNKKRNLQTFLQSATNDTAMPTAESIKAGT